MTVETLSESIADLTADRPRMLAMAEIAHRLRVTDAAAQVADLCLAAATVGAAGLPV
jgi:UDP-N-acetylglucosamine:LPS N-acetylglucosamine transferase